MLNVCRVNKRLRLESVQYVYASIVHALMYKFYNAFRANQMETHKCRLPLYLETFHMALDPPSRH